jgi:hypothetical protein
MEEKEAAPETVYWKADTSSVGRASGCQPEPLFVASVAVRMLSERIAVANRPSDHNQHKLRRGGGNTGPTGAVSG